jgi:7-cyano-7-deazaguanine synthase
MMMNSVKKAVVLSSGGIDSTTVMAIAKNEGYELYSLSFFYGQRHAFELKAAQKVAEAAGVAGQMTSTYPKTGMKRK